MRKDNINRMFPDLLFDIFFDRRKRLFIRPSFVTVTQFVELIYAVCATDYDALLAFQIKDIAVYRKQNIRKILLKQHPTIVPCFFLIGAYILRSILVIAVNAEKCGSHIAELVLQKSVTHLTSVIQSHIAEQYNDVLWCRMKPHKQFVDRIG